MQLEFQWILIALCFVVASVIFAKRLDAGPELACFWIKIDLFVSNVSAHNALRIWSIRVPSWLILN